MDRMNPVAPLVPTLRSTAHKGLWRHMPLYTVMANVVTGLAARGVPVALGGGSYLGSMRHHGHVPMQDKDGDLWVFSTNTSLIESVLDAVKGADFRWGRQNDGAGPIRTPGSDIISTCNAILGTSTCGSTRIRPTYFAPGGTAGASVGSPNTCRAICRITM